MPELRNDRHNDRSLILVSIGVVRILVPHYKFDVALSVWTNRMEVSSGSLSSTRSSDDTEPRGFRKCEPAWLKRPIIFLKLSITPVSYRSAPDDFDKIFDL